MTFASGFVAWKTHENQRALHLLEERGEAGEAEIVRRFVVPTGSPSVWSTRLSIQPGISATRNVEVEPGFWNGLEGAKSIAVIWVPGEPSVSRLLFGEVPDREFTKTPVGGYGLATLGGLLALFLLGASPFMWNGWDLAARCPVEEVVIEALRQSRVELFVISLEIGKSGREQLRS